MLITNIPITYLAYVNQDAPRHILMEHPELYKEINNQSSRLYYFKVVIFKHILAVLLGRQFRIRQSIAYRYTYDIKQLEYL